MAHVISDECIACGSCEAQCPVNAISMGDGKYEINPDECIDCGACGSPKCRAFAEDIVAGRAEAGMCVFSDKNDKDK